MQDFELVDKSDMTSPKKPIKKSSNSLEKINENNQNKKFNSNNEHIVVNKNIIKIDNEKIEEKHLEIKNNKCYNDFNRMLYSKNCIYYYITLLIISFCTFIYTLSSFFLKLSK